MEESFKLGKIVLVKIVPIPPTPPTTSLLGSKKIHNEKAVKKTPIFIKKNSFQNFFEQNFSFNFVNIIYSSLLIFCKYPLINKSKSPSNTPLGFPFSILVR